MSLAGKNRIMQLARNSASHGFRPGAVILLYHRVADVPTNLWAMSVSPARFDAHLRILRQFTNPMPLAELAGRASTGTLPGRSVAITFDDGYVDNLGAAKPLLDRYGLSATVFATGQTVAGSEAFWWDDLARYTVHAPNLPPRLSLQIEDTTVEWQCTPGACDSPSFEERVGLCNQVRTAIQAVQPQTRRRVLDDLAAWSGHPAAPPSAGRPMSPEELRELARGGTIEIGAHTMSHPSLPALDNASQRGEVVDARSLLEAALDAPVTSFSYPFGDAGDLGNPLDHVVASAGFLRSCTSERRTVRGLEAPFRLPRYSVGDWPAWEFAARLAAWFME